MQEASEVSEAEVVSDGGGAKKGTGLVITVKVVKGDDSVEHMGAFPIDAIEFLCGVQRAIELGRSIKTADPSYGQDAAERYAKMVGGVAGLLGQIG